MSIKVAIFDLDGTLIDTESIKIFLFNYLGQIGFDKVQAKQIYKNARDFGGKNKFSLNVFKNEVINNTKMCGRDFDEMAWGKMISGLNNLEKNILVEGVEDVFSFFKERDIPTYILTLGVKEWQIDKIKLSGLDKIVLSEGVMLEECDNIICTENEDVRQGKILEIKNILSKFDLASAENIIFFNDKPDETDKILEEFPGMHAFLRKDYRNLSYRDEDYESIVNLDRVIKISNNFNFIDDLKKHYGNIK